MKRFKDSLQRHGICVAIMILFFLSGGNAFGAEESGNWRSTYDVVMLWLNFLILVFLLIKFAKDPIKNFLKGQQDELSKEIGGLEQQRGIGGRVLGLVLDDGVEIAGIRNDPGHGFELI